jgi:hypothetical protein
MSKLVLVAVLAFASSARADKSDWNQFIDKNPSAPVESKPVHVAPETKTAAAKAKQTPHKSVAKPKAKVHAKAKPRGH